MENLGKARALHARPQQVDINALLKKTPKLIGKVQSMNDKIDSITLREDGTVVHNILRLAERNRNYRRHRKIYRNEIA